MFINKLSNKIYDVIIIGSGPAGISSALRFLERSKLNILLVESGALDKNEKIQTLSSVVAKGDLSSSYYPNHAQRVFGGTSNVWSGYCTILEKRSFSTNQWPIDYRDIYSYYKDAAKILGLPQESWSTPYKTIIEGVDSILYRPYYLSSPPIRFKHKYLSHLQNSNNIDVLLNSTCTNIELENGVVKNILISSSHEDSIKNESVKAKDYILACGGIGNAKLLQNAKIACQSSVGNYFMEHPHIYKAGTLELDYKILAPILSDGKISHALQLSDKFCVKNNLLSFTVGFTIKSIKKKVFLGEKKDVVLADAIIRSEMQPIADNRVFLGDGYDYLGQAKTNVLFNFNYQKLAKKNWNNFSNELLSSGIGRATTPPNIDYNITGGGHYIGTTRMGRSELNSVVDKNCRVHQFDNLYIAGSSIFSAAAAANPTFSIVAFSLRLSDYIIGKHLL